MKSTLSVVLVFEPDPACPGEPLPLDNMLAILKAHGLGPAYPNPTSGSPTVTVDIPWPRIK